MEKLTPSIGQRTQRWPLDYMGRCRVFHSQQSLIYRGVIVAGSLSGYTSEELTWSNLLVDGRF
jgi:hypothetical protein